MLRRLLRVALPALTILLLPATAQAAGEYAPLDRPGPALSVPPAALQASLYCEPGVRNATREPVLLSPGTGVTVEQNFSWNWERALDQLGIPWCAYSAPGNTLGDIQISGEYLVYAIRTMRALAGRPIAVMGHSQGGMSMRWPLRFWPDTRAMVDDVIGLAGSNHGTTVGDSCSRGCVAASWQQGARSNFIAALNSRAETFPGISYTEIYTHTDEVLQPNQGPDATGPLHGGGGAITNVATQDICPADIDEHLLIGTIDSAAYGLAVDALTHPGPADPARVDRGLCNRLYMPGVDPLNAQNYLQVLGGVPGLLSVPGGVSFYEPVRPAEPPLACYVFAACAGSGSGSAGTGTAVLPTACVSGRRFAIHLRPSLRNVRVTVSGRRVVVRRARGGRWTAVVDLRGATRTSVVVRVRARDARGRTVRQSRRYRPCRTRRA